MENNFVFDILSMKDLDERLKDSSLFDRIVPLISVPLFLLKKSASTNLRRSQVLEALLTNLKGICYFFLPLLLQSRLIHRMSCGMGLWAQNGDLSWCY